MAKWWNRQTHDAQNVAPRRHGSSTLPLVTAEWTGVWFPERSHKPFDAGSNPASATWTAEYANVVKRPGREPGERLWVRFPPRLLKMIPWSSGQDSWPTFRQRWFESIRDHWSAGVAATLLRGKEEGRVQVPGGPLRRLGCWSNRTTPAPHAGNEGASPSRSTQNSGGRKAVIRQLWE